MPVPIKTMSKSSAVSSSNINDEYEKTISEYQKYKYRIVNQTDTHSELEKPSSYWLEGVFGVIGAIVFLQSNWIVGGVMVLVSVLLSILTSVNKKNRVYIRITKNNTLDVTGYTLAKSRVSKKTAYIVIGSLVALVALLLIVFAVSMSML